MSPTDKYVRRHFVDRTTFIRRCGGSADEIETLVDAGAAPGVIYSQSPDGKWWSALDRYDNAALAVPPTGGSDWYAPSAIWWVRRALLTARGEVQPPNADIFAAQFLQALQHVPSANLNYPACFDGHTVNVDSAREVAISEWNDWVSGPYAVCLSYFSGEACVRKEVNACRIRLHFDNADKGFRLSPIELFDLVEQLAALLMPFAPKERASGTPGKALDRTLTALQLGIEEPYDS